MTFLGLKSRELSRSRFRKHWVRRKDPMSLSLSWNKESNPRLTDVSRAGKKIQGKTNCSARFALLTHKLSHYSYDRVFMISYFLFNSFRRCPKKILYVHAASICKYCRRCIFCLQFACRSFVYPGEKWGAGTIRPNLYQVPLLQYVLVTTSSFGRNLPPKPRYYLSCSSFRQLTL